MNTLQWADYYPKVPDRGGIAAHGPDVGIMHIDQLATNAARRVIIPLDDIASGLELAEADFTPTVWNGRRLPGQALRHPAGRPPAGLLLTTPTQLDEGRPQRAAHGPGAASRPPSRS